MSTTVKFMVVDDENDVEMLFRQHFRKEIRKGILDFDFAFSGKEAISKLENKQPPDVVCVFSDINMPGMSGMELLEIIQERYPHIPVNMISAYANDDYMNKAHLKGAEGFFSKPIDFTALKKEIHRIIADETSKM